MISQPLKTVSAERPPALEADFIISAAAAHQFPEPELPELALLGRSNAGKSSLMNRWLGRKGLARVGATPGRTRLVNFFKITWNKGQPPFMMADLPGYGFAAAPKDMVAGWRKLVADYLESGRPLKMALLMMDIRRAPQDEEFGLLTWLNELSIPAWVIATKADKLSQAERSKRLNVIKKAFAENLKLERPPLPFSATTGFGRNQLIETLIDSGLLTSGPAIQNASFFP
ncbi:YihA family ribosome biogenesis GTP-binding protein [Deltaproteobacteria bacterium Smac51]|nr:YihA family ribosome biogenesis GTP-binding protein [Deltaproteobacteria bacterium Smac51]